MQTASTAASNGKFDTIQPIEGAKGNIVKFYYQGKYPIYKSLDDNMYHLKSVMDAFKASSDNDIKKCDICEWKKLESTRRLIEFLSNHGYPCSEPPICKKRQQNIKMQYLDGWYGCEKLMLDLAGWLDRGFHCEIYDVFAMSAERDRLNADINHKQSTIDELNSKVDELLRINKEQTVKLDDMSYRLKKTYITVQSIADLPDKLTNNISSGNTIENVYIYTLPDECDDETMIIHLAARTDQSLKQLKSKLPNDHTIINHFTIANAKDCIREIIGEAESYGIVQEVRPTYAITITTDDLDTFKSAVEVILRKLNRSSKVVKRTVETTNKVNPYEYISKEWNIDETIINDILKVHSITIDQLLSIVNGTLNYKRNEKEYTVKFCRKSPYLIYGRQIDGSIKWFGVKRGYFSDNA
jgi:hypothetical protein